MEGAIETVGRFGAAFYANVETTDGCWLWTSERDSRGYARFPSLAHRLSYELHHGPIERGMRVVQTCGIRHCVNPEHLEALTISEANSRARKTAA